MEKFTTTGGDTLPPCTFTPPQGKSFVGWNTKADRSGSVYKDQETVDPYSDLTLYAMWGNVAKVTTVTGTTTEYSTFSAAFEAAKQTNGSTLTLLQEVFSKDSIDITGNLTLDLNGQSLSNTSTTISMNIIQIQESATLVIKDSSTSKQGGIYYTANKDYSNVIRNSGTLTIEGGTIKNTGTTQNSYTIFTEGGTVTINGGTISSTSANAINKSLSATDKVTLTVSGGTISSTNADAIALGSDDTITISGGTISSEKGAAIKPSLDGGTATISGGTIKSNGTYAISGLDIILSGNPTIQGKNADICLRSDNSYWKNNKIAGSLTMATPLKITDGKATTKWYSTSTVFTADTGYTITAEDVQKLSFVDSTGAVYKAVLGNYTYTYNLELSGSSIVLKGTPNY